MNLSTAFADCAEKHARKTAVFWGETEISYAALLAQSQKIAGHLQTQFGVQPGDRVALWMKNCPEFVSSVFGILHAGAVVVPGSLPSAGGKYSLSCAVIVKRVDAQTRAKTSINELLRNTD